MSGLLDAEERYMERIELLKEGLLAPRADKGWLHQLIGNSYEMLGQYREAVSHYRQSLMNTVSNYNSEGLNKCIRRVREKQLLRLFKMEKVD